MENYKVIINNPKYEVSDLGNVRNTKTGRILKGVPNLSGYLKVKLDKKFYLIHRLVAITFLDNPENKRLVDHINSSVVDNKLTNLRWATYSENARNSKINKNNTSGHKGVCLYNDKWKAQITIDGIQIHIGVYKTKEEAINARILKANQAFGSFISCHEQIKV